MKNLSKKIEVGANVAIIGVALLIGFTVVKTYLFSNGTNTKALDHQVPVGTAVSLPGVEWEKNKRTLLVGLQKGCPFCTTSAPFYQRLMRETAGRPDLKVVAVLPHDVSESQSYLDELSVPINEVRQASLKKIGAKGTPVLILVNARGIVEASWVGKLDSSQESEVLKKLQAVDAAAK